MLGIDVSSYQLGIDFSKLSPKPGFAIVKLTEGKSAVSSAGGSLIEMTLGNEMCLGAYHYARPDINSTPALMVKEAENFCSALAKNNIIGKAVLALDWEVEPLEHGDLAVVWIEKVYSETGVKPLIYASKSTFESPKFKFIGDKYLKWLAYWPSISTFEVKEDTLDVLDMYANNVKDISFAIWQFTSRGKFKGYDKYLDLDYAALTPYGWSDLTKSNNKSEIITPEMEWAINAGLFKGYPDGLYHPKDCLTREQAAALFYRYNEFLNRR